MCFAVADPELQIRRRPGHPGPEIRGTGEGGGVGDWSAKKLFLALWAPVWSKNEGKA